ncbi:GNAT family N-acetyltransferase [Streptomyces sp. Edi2]|uniref:GNAT family N-acetyltransferase n=1 Tax=Streptomyces sp. Edi2 TaxID=3162528 RepID=UPI0033057E23
MIKVHVLDGSSALAWMAERWRDLYEHDRGASPFQSPGWLLGWASQLTPPADPLVLVAADGKKVCAALALVCERDKAGKVLVRPLAAPHSEYVDAVGPSSQEPAVAAALADRLVGLAHEGLSVELSDVSMQSPLGQAMLRQPGWRHSTLLCAVVALPLDMSSMTKSLRRQHTQRERRLSVGGYRVSYHRTRTAEELLDVYPGLNMLHAARWARDPASRRQGAEPTAWLDVLRQCGGETAFIASMSVDGKLAAAQLCLYRGHRCYSVLPAMHPDMLHLSPGHLLLRQLATSLADLGFSTLDLGRTVESPGQIGYKAQYNPRWSLSLTSAFDGVLNGGEEFSSAPNSSVGSSAAQ